MGISIPAAMGITAGLNFLGGLFGGAEQGKISAAQLAEQQRQFNLPLEYQLSRYQMAGPMRDRAAYMLMSRMGVPPTAMHLDPHGFSSPGLGAPGQQQGGPAMGQYAQAAARYQPGAGGMMQNPVVNQIMGGLIGNQSKPSALDVLHGRVPPPKQGGQQMPYYGPMNAGAAYGSPGGSGY